MPAPTATLTAANVPIPVINTSLNKLADAYNTTGITGANTLPTLVAGSTSLSAKWNKTALAIELIGRKGCGTYAIINGLTISTGSGLNLGVAAGQAIIDGIVEIASATTLALPANIARCHIWLKQDGTLTYVSNSTTPPAGNVCYLGSAVTGASSISSVDFSGVLYSLGAIAVRYTADTTTPGDSPNANGTFITVGTNGSYIWTGYAYLQLGTAAQWAEFVQDIVGAMFTNSTGLSWTYTDGAGTIAGTIDLSAFTADNLPAGTSNKYGLDIHPGFITGCYYDIGDMLGQQRPLISTSGALSPNANGTVWYFPFPLTQKLVSGNNFTVTELDLYVRTAVALSDFRLGIYAHDKTTGKPTGAPLVDSGSIASTSTGNKASGAISCTLTIGNWYWLAFYTKYAIAVDSFNGGAFPSLGATTAGDTTIYGCWYENTGSYGALPTVGSLTRTAFGSFSTPARIQMKV